MVICFEQLFFIFFSTLALISALLVVVLRNPVRSALALVVTFIASSGLWMLLNAEFLSLILVLVYVGAVMTLFLFIVMTLNLDKDIEQEGFVRYLPYGIVILALVAGLVIYALRQARFTAMNASLMDHPVNYSNIKALGEILYTDYAYPFELAGVLLLIAIIAAISLDLTASKAKKQQISKQVATDPKQQIRLVK